MSEFKEDFDIFQKWRNSGMGKIAITENWQAGAMLEFANFFHKEKQARSKAVTDLINCLEGSTSFLLDYANLEGVDKFASMIISSQVLSNEMTIKEYKPCEK